MLTASLFLVLTTSVFLMLTASLSIFAMLYNLYSLIFRPAKIWRGQIYFFKILNQFLNKNYCLHQHLKFDNSLYIVHAKQFVLIIEFPAGRHLEMWRLCVVVPVSTLDRNNSNERVGSGTATQLRHISRWRPAGNSVIKTNHLAWIIYRELSNWAADVDTSWGKLWIEINVVGQPRFPLTYFEKFSSPRLLQMLLPVHFLIKTNLALTTSEIPEKLLDLWKLLPVPRKTRGKRELLCTPVNLLGSYGNISSVL